MTTIALVAFVSTPPKCDCRHALPYQSHGTYTRTGGIRRESAHVKEVMHCLSTSLSSAGTPVKPTLLYSTLP
jgi:hypothetical protein